MMWNDQKSPHDVPMMLLLLGCDCVGVLLKEGMRTMVTQPCAGEKKLSDQWALFQCGERCHGKCGPHIVQNNIGGGLIVRGG